MPLSRPKHDSKRYAASISATREVAGLVRGGRLIYKSLRIFQPPTVPIVMDKYALRKLWPRFTSPKNSPGLSRPIAAPLLVLVAGFWMCGVNQAVVADSTDNIDIAPAKPGRSIEYRDRLVAGLQARLKSETAFIDAVVDKVEAGKLPRTLVDQTFFWARERVAAKSNGRLSRPIIYFKPAMIARAKRLGLAL